MKNKQDEEQHSFEREEEAKKIYAEIAAYAAEYAGTEFDLDVELEAAAYEFFCANADS